MKAPGWIRYIDEKPRMTIYKCNRCLNEQETPLYCKHYDDLLFVLQDEDLTIGLCNACEKELRDMMHCWFYHPKDFFYNMRNHND